MNRKLFLILPVICGVFWGSGGLFVRIFNDFGMNSVTILSSRVSLACLCLFILILLFDRDSLKIKLKDSWLFVCTGILGAFLLNMCYNEAAFKVSLSLAALLLSLAPVFALFISAVLFKEKITKKKLICLVMAIFGSFLVSGFLDNNNSFSLYGVLFGLLSAFFWALYGVFSKLATNKGYSSFTITFYSFLVITIVLLPFTQWDIFNAFLSTNQPYNIVLALLNSILVGVLPYLLFSFSLNHIDNGLATILCSGSEPISATLWGALFYFEYPTFLNIVGIIITLFALSVLINAGESD